jgi:hypothetical protein
VGRVIGRRPRSAGDHPCLRPGHDEDEGADGRIDRRQREREHGRTGHSGKAAVTTAQVLLVAAAGVFVVVYGLLAGDLVRGRGARDETVGASFGVELAETMLPLAAVLAAIAVAVAGLGRTGPR